MNKHTGAIIAMILLLLPLVYVGSYCALVEPFWGVANYRFGGRTSTRIYWPLEQVDRRVRPGVWQPPPWPVRIQVYLCPTHWEPTPSQAQESPTPLD